MSLSENSGFADLIQQARHEVASQSTPEERATLEAAGFRFLARGFNNSVYVFESEGQSYCLKFYRVDERHRAEREWQALQFLTDQSHQYPPQPFFFDKTDPAHPAIVMEWVKGEPLSGPLNHSQLEAIVEYYRAMFAIRPDSAKAHFQRCGGDADRIQERVRAWSQTLDLFNLADERLETARLMRQWFNSEKPAYLAQAAPPVFSRGDANLTNFLWENGRLRAIDFEYSGWTDKAFDLADLIEHVSARATSDQNWDWFIEQFKLTAAEYKRFQISRQLFGLFWLMKFWDDTTGFRPQLKRVKLLLQPTTSD